MLYCFQAPPKKMSSVTDGNGFFFFSYCSKFPRKRQTQMAQGHERWFGIIAKGVDYVL